MANISVVPQSQGAAIPVAALVGAGPGDPTLITLAGAAMLAQARVVIYDALANKQLLTYCPPDTEFIYVGKRAREHTLTQDQINTLLLEKCRELTTQGQHPGRYVVRLKGGDPYVFGRGGEEAQVLSEAKIPFTVIPGITAGIAGPAYAGIPVTHRDFTSTVTFVTGHQQQNDSSKPATGDSEDQCASVDYGALAKLGGTLVFYMGVKNLPDITRRLLTAGMPSDTLAAVVRMATHPEQQTVIGQLGTIAALVKQANIQAPAITIIGKVVAMRTQLNWFENLPLFGQTVLVTRTRQQASELGKRLEALGAKVIEAPTIEIVKPSAPRAVRTAISNMSYYDCVVFTSANGVRATWEIMNSLKMDTRDFPAAVAAIGPATAAALHALAITPEIVAEDAIGEELAAALIDYFGSTADRSDHNALDLSGNEFLLLRAEIARPSLVNMLRQAGAEVTDVPVYQTRIPKTLSAEATAAIRNGTVNWLTFTSASTAKNLYAMLPEDLREVVKQYHRLSIGPMTTKALCDVGWPPTVEAKRHDIPGMVEMLLRYHRGH
ncbi:MAG: uroporphyrinogen-III C-methyltransferase [Phycisphaerae bacterium]